MVLPGAASAPPKDAEWRARMCPEMFTADQDVARAKLVDYWQRLGFKAIPDTKLLGLNPSMRHPSLPDAILDG